MDSQRNIDALFKKAQLTPTAISFSESKRFFIEHAGRSAANANGKRSFFNLKNILIMIGTIGILGILITFSLPNKEVTNVVQQQTDNLEKSAVKQSSTRATERVSDETTPERATQQLETWSNLIQPLPAKEIYQKKDRSRQKGKYPLFMQNPSFTQKTDPIPFPKLTEEEIAANHKQKKKMIKALSKFDSKEYAYIPSSSYSYQGVTVSVQAFFMQRKEVTNLEFRTFLFDLLIQDRKEEFLLAAPDQTLWTTALDDSLIYYQNNYFSDHVYDDFPVVNVSRKGAEMYCKWITAETNKTRESDFINDARIPEILEWSLAASNIGKNTMYPWEGDQLTNDDKFNANFKLDEYDGDLQSIRQKTKVESPRTTYEFTTGQLIAPADEYGPNELGLYNISGNVAEMISMKIAPEEIDPVKASNNQIVTCGGSWMSAPDELKVYNETLSDHINGHPSIGFRIVVTYLRR